MNRYDPKFLAPVLNEARLSRQYSAVRARLDRAPSRRWLRWSSALAVAAAAALACALFLRRQVVTSFNAGAVEGTTVESTGDGEGTSLTLVEGSRLALGAHTRARLTSARPEAIRIDLERGRVEIEATHMPGRTFVVGAAAYEVRVVGTHFVVERAPGDHVSVSVERGAVDVIGGGETRRLAAGEHWSASEAPAATTAAAPAPPEAAAMPPAAPTKGPSEPSRPAVTVPPEETARELFDRGQQAKADGRPQDAVRAFDRLRRTFRRDRHASLAAFELGRLELDVLDDPHGAEEAFRDAMALGPTSPFRQDAEARRVEALSRLHDDAACAAARDAYLARWPNGTYRRAVELYCGPR